MPERFERFTERAKEVVELASDEARTLRHAYVGTEHLLLGLLAQEVGLGARVLESLGVSIDEARAQVERIVGRGSEPAPAKLPFTPRSKKVLELALREALSLGHNYIGTEHILLGLVRENEGVAARILLDFDVTTEQVRDEIIRLLAGPAERGRPKRTILRSSRRGREYRVEDLEPLRADRLNELGLEGWELVTVAGDKLVFRR